MDRKSFIRKTFVTGALSFFIPKSIYSSNKNNESSTYDLLKKRVGFNHLPAENQDLSNKKQKKMDKIIHRAETRGVANHGWLNSHHSFSFANYHNPNRMNFGVLRVLNDDVVEAGEGFGTHPHDNMEIISIPLEGDLEHKDSMGNKTIINEGDVQVMSAGTGVTHSEYNKNKDKAVKFLQIWLFPNEKNLTPRYDQISLNEIKKENEIYQILSPNKDDEGVWLNQDAWFHMGDFSKETDQIYQLKKKGNGVYFFVLEGTIQIDEDTLKKRDGMGVWNTDRLSFKASKNTSVLMMEVPMNL